MWVPVTTAWDADGGDGHLIRRVAANVLNKQCRTAIRSDPPTCGLGEELHTPHDKKIYYKILHRASAAGCC